MGNSDTQMFAALARTAEWSLGDFNVQALANTAWAFATANQSDAQLFAALARAAQQRMGAFDAQELGNIAWSIPTVSESHALMFMPGAWSSADRELDRAKWAVSIAGSSISNEPMEMSL